jgi:hypothetical protein
MHDLTANSAEMPKCRREEGRKWLVNEAEGACKDVDARPG